MGTEKIAQHLNEKGIRSNGGRLFRCNSINRIISNHLIIGYYKRRDVKSIHLPELQIIEDELFHKAQTIKEERSIKRNNDRMNATSGKHLGLLSGNLFCGDCGCRMGAYAKHEWYRKKDGTIQDYGYVDYYHCLKKRQYKCCKGQTSYLSRKVDKEILKLLNVALVKTSYVNKKAIIDRNAKDNLIANENRRHEKEKALITAKKEIKRLYLEIAGALEGKSIFTAVELKQAIADQNEVVSKYKQDLLGINEEIANREIIYSNIKIRYDEFCDWAVRFKDMDADEKRYVANQLLYKVTINRGYKMRIELNMEYKRFFEGINIQEETLLEII